MNGIRYHEPAQDNYYYIRTVDGGVNPCIEGLPVDGNLTALSNCVGYVVGRWNEYSGERACVGLRPCMAGSMFKYAKEDGLSVGYTPKIGAVICFGGGSGGDGHVGIVEQIVNYKKIIVSESVYGGVAFRRREYTKEKGKWTWGNPSYTWQGFIYNPFITNADVLKVRKMIANKENNLNYDFNGDGQLNMKDVLLLRRSVILK